MRRFFILTLASLSLFQTPVSAEFHSTGPISPVIPSYNPGATGGRGFIQYRQVTTVRIRYQTTSYGSYGLRGGYGYRPCGYMPIGYRGGFCRRPNFWATFGGALLGGFLGGLFGGAFRC